jgi:hypothetical protein
MLARGRAWTVSVRAVVVVVVVVAGMALLSASGMVQAVHVSLAGRDVPPPRVH